MPAEGDTTLVDIGLGLIPFLSLAISIWAIFEVRRSVKKGNFREEFNSSVRNKIDLLRDKIGEFSGEIDIMAFRLENRETADTRSLIEKLTLLQRETSQRVNDIAQLSFTDTEGWLSTDESEFDRAVVSINSVDSTAPASDKAEHLRNASRALTGVSNLLGRQLNIERDQHI